MRDDVLLYLSGPITAKHGRTIEDNVAAAMNVFWRCMEHNLPAIVPHATAIYPTAYTHHYDKWLRLDYIYIDRCTHVILLPNWEQSSGALLEAEYARTRGKVLLTVAQLEALRWLDDPSTT